MFYKLLVRMTLSKIPGPRKVFLVESSLEKLPAILLKMEFITIFNEESFI